MMSGSDTERSNGSHHAMRYPDSNSNHQAIANRDAAASRVSSGYTRSSGGGYYGGSGISFDFDVSGEAVAKGFVLLLLLGALGFLGYWINSNNAEKADAVDDFIAAYFDPDLYEREWSFEETRAELLQDFEQEWGKSLLKQEGFGRGEYYTALEALSKRLFEINKKRMGPYSWSLKRGLMDNAVTAFEDKWGKLPYSTHSTLRYHGL